MPLGRRIGIVHEEVPQHPRERIILRACGVEAHEGEAVLADRVPTGPR